LLHIVVVVACEIDDVVAIAIAVAVALLPLLSTAMGKDYLPVVAAHGCLSAVDNNLIQRQRNIGFFFELSLVASRGSMVCKVALTFVFVFFVFLSNEMRRNKYKLEEREGKSTVG
jgi:hypothetical protein